MPSSVAPFPSDIPLAVFAAAAIAGHFSLGRGWRNYLVLAAQTICLAGAIMVVLYAVYYTSYRLFSPEWIRLALYGPHTKRQWAELVLLSFSVVAYWIGGAFLARRRMTYYSVCSRFDIGLAAFFCLFLIELVIVTKGGPRIGAHLKPLLPFLFSPPLSSRYRDLKGKAGRVPQFSPRIRYCRHRDKFFRHSPSFRRLCDPLLSSHPPEGSGSRLRSSGRPEATLSLPLLSPSFAFSLAPAMHRPDLPSPSSKGVAGFDHILGPTTWLGRLFEDVMQWGMKVFFGLMLLFAAALFIYVIVRWLLRRSGSSTERERPRDGGEGWLARLSARS